MELPSATRSASPPESDRDDVLVECYLRLLAIARRDEPMGNGEQQPAEAEPKPAAVGSRR